VAHVSEKCNISRLLSHQGENRDLRLIATLQPAIDRTVLHTRFAPVSSVTSMANSVRVLRPSQQPRMDRALSHHRRIVMMYDNMSSALLIDNRNERQLLVASIAIAAAWSIVFLLGRP
jgi:hypothetical protein